MADENRPAATLILGVGNIIMGDEGFGVHVVRRLEESRLPGHVRVVEGGVGGFNLLGLLEGVERLIVVDVMITDKPTGEVLFFKAGPDMAEPGKRVLSFHQIGALELVRLWGLLGHEPEVFFLVTRPVKLECGMELSPPVQEAAGKAVKLLEELSRDDFSVLERSCRLCTL